MEISKRAILVNLSISTWMATKFDRKVTAKVNTDYKASEDTGRWNKHLLAWAGVHKAVLNAAANARNVHYTNTLPWTDEGDRLLPTKNFFGYTEKMRVERGKFDATLAELYAQYPQLLIDAPMHLGQMHQPEDFPKLVEIQKKFGWTLVTKPLPAAGDYRVSLPPELLHTLETDTQQRIQGAVDLAMQDAWKRLHAIVSRVKQAATPDGKVYNNLMDRTLSDLDLVASLNVTDNQELENLRKQAETLTTVDPEDLRDNESVQQQTERKTDEILDAMSAFYIPVKGVKDERRNS